jgi:excisionase family DNA binding protein
MRAAKAETLPPAQGPFGADAKKYWPTKDIAELFGVSDRLIRSMVADGRLLGFKVGRRKILVPLHSLRGYIRRGLDAMQGADPSAEE